MPSAKVKALGIAGSLPSVMTLTLGIAGVFAECHDFDTQQRARLCWVLALGKGQGFAECQIFNTQ